MSSGLTRKEQWGLLGLVGLMLLGLGLRQWRAGHYDDADVLAIEGQGTWRKLAELDATNPGAADAPARQMTARTGPSALTDDRGGTTGLLGGQLAGQIDLNHADQALIESLPGIGPAKAQAILALRARLGGFSKVEQLNDVSGIGEKTLERLRPLITLRAAAPTSQSSEQSPQSTRATPAVENRTEPVSAQVAAPEAAPRPSEAPAPALSSATPKSRAAVSGASARVNINTATTAELEGLPGIGPALAERIIEHRRSNGPFRTVDELDRVSGIGPKKLQQLRPLVDVR